jgi:hypothetical protein
VNDSTFIIQAKDVSWKPERNACSRCGAPEKTPETPERNFLTKAVWNGIEFRYCLKCAEGK